MGDGRALDANEHDRGQWGRAHTLGQWTQKRRNGWFVVDVPFPFRSVCVFRVPPSIPPRSCSFTNCPHCVGSNLISTRVILSRVKNPPNPWCVMFVFCHLCFNQLYQAWWRRRRCVLPLLRYPRRQLPARGRRGGVRGRVRRSSVSKLFLFKLFVVRFICLILN